MTSPVPRKFLYGIFIILACIIFPIVYLFPELFPTTYRIGSIDDNATQETLCLPIAPYMTPFALRQRQSSNEITLTKRGREFVCISIGSAC